VPGIGSEASGITYRADTRTYFAVSDLGALSEFNDKGRVLRQVKLSGFADVEGIAYVEDDTFAVVEEGNGRIVIFELKPKARAVLRSDAWAMEVDDTSGNRGLEGLAYDAKGKAFYTVKERGPRRIYKVTRAGKVTRLWDIEKHNLRLNDLSGIYFHAGTGHLLLVSDESRGVVECTTDGKYVSSIGIGLGKAEGVTMDDKGRLIVCGEDSQLQVYAKPKK